ARLGATVSTCAFGNLLGRTPALDFGPRTLLSRGPGRGLDSQRPLMFDLRLCPVPGGLGPDCREVTTRVTVVTEPPPRSPCPIRSPPSPSGPLITRRSSLRGAAEPKGTIECKQHLLHRSRVT